MSDGKEHKLVPALGNIELIMRGSFALLGHAISLAMCGQCLTSIPSSAVIVSTTYDAIVDGNGQFFWACPQAYHQVFLGNNNTIWVEDGAIVGVSGDNNTIWYRCTSTSLGLYGDNNIVTVNSLANVIDHGTQTTIHVCDMNGIVFDLGDAPDPGCLSTSIDAIAELGLSVSVDHSLGSLLIHASSTVREVIIFDAQGRAALRTSGANSEMISLAPLGAGFYIASIRTDEGLFAHKFNTY